MERGSASASCARQWRTWEAGLGHSPTMTVVRSSPSRSHLGAKPRWLLRPAKAGSALKPPANLRRAARCEPALDADVACAGADAERDAGDEEYGAPGAHQRQEPGKRHDYRPND